MAKKISELPKINFSGDIIDNCFYVHEMFTPNMSAVRLDSVFNEIIRRAKEDGGLSVSLDSNGVTLKPI